PPTFLPTTPTPPTSHLFPYTTLFRSHGKLDASVAAADFHVDVHRRQIPESPPLRRPRLEVIAHRDRPAGPSGRTRAVDLQPLALDRKSTRLNSSHVAISYGVFCWKKN